MQTFEMDNLHDLYKDMSEYVLNHGTLVSPRGKLSKECLNVSAKLTNIYNDVINFKQLNRDKRVKAYLDYKEKELEWYKSGSLIAKDAHAKIWVEIADPNGKIQSNYGYIILKQVLDYTTEGCTPYQNAIFLLKKDKDTRQAILHYNLPFNYNTLSADIPCTICAQIFIRNDKLSMLVYQRSSDLYIGFPYDIPWHCWLMKKLIKELEPNYKKLEAGDLEIIFGSIHIYEDKFNFFNFGADYDS